MHLQNNDLLQAIIEQPDDDQLRLVYADWLEEHGDAARAEFIRVQIEYHTMRCSDPRVDAMTARWIALLETHKEAWLKGFPAWLRAEFPVEGTLLGGSRFSRGFVEAVCNTANWNEIGDPGVQALAQSPFLHQLQTLELECNRIGDAGVAALARSRFSGNLRRLHLGDNPFTEVGARALAESPYLDQIEHLSVHGIYSWKADKLPRSACDMLVQRFGNRVHL